MSSLNQNSASEQPSHTDDAKQAALDLLKSPELMSKFLSTCRERYIGREKELILVKLATISRRFDRGLSMIITGPSSVGKSELIKTVLDTVPPEARQDFTRVTTNYLLYTDLELSHKVIIFNELNGSEETAHILRTALTEGTLRLGTVNKGISGNLSAGELSKSTAGLIVLSTSTRSSIDHELLTRIVVLELSHDAELARQVLKSKAARAAHGSSKGGELNKATISQGVTLSSSPAQASMAILPRIWQIADSLLEPLEIAIPYGDKLANLFPTHEERFMRDFDKVLTLIKASALFHQFQREKDSEERILADKDDYKLIYDLSDFIVQTDSIPPHIITFIKVADELKRTTGAEPSREAIQEKLKVSDATIKRYISKAYSKELIEVCGKGKEQIIRVSRVPESLSPLPTPSALLDNL
ncbi:MAG: hypothetical protein K8I29_07805 [Alphaproteobacteria bacterium]|uniref:Uncharacterized protein n=1 Tax=Candidatus Nitrobium versatile TaxID=2884831 RepID=A0A953M159_9BACT|nr:hypothetical protein [Candidatus Nitrobium versatile]